MDIKFGIDVLVVKSKKTFAVSLFTGTERAQKARLKKQFRHERRGEFEYVELPVAFEGSRKCGEFFLYSTRELEQLERKISDY